MSRHRVAHADDVVRALFVSARSSHPFAIARSRMTVAGEVRDAAAVSSTVNPAKKRDDASRVGIEVIDLLQRVSERQPFDSLAGNTLPPSWYYRHRANDITQVARRH